MDTRYYEKYLKYKIKYQNLKESIGGMVTNSPPAAKPPSTVTKPPSTETKPLSKEITPTLPVPTIPTVQRIAFKEQSELSNILISISGNNYPLVDSFNGSRALDDGKHFIIAIRTFILHVNNNSNVPQTGVQKLNYRVEGSANINNIYVWYYYKGNNVIIDKISTDEAGKIRVSLVQGSNTNNKIDFNFLFRNI